MKLLIFFASCFFFSTGSTALSPHIFSFAFASAFSRIALCQGVSLSEKKKLPVFDTFTCGGCASRALLPMNTFKSELRVGEGFRNGFWPPR